MHVGVTYKVKNFEIDHIFAKKVIQRRIGLKEQNILIKSIISKIFLIPEIPDDINITISVIGH